jgi:hypothetical protein
MVCQTFEYNALQKENWAVRTKKLQIINGGQTCRTIHQTVKGNPDIDFSDVTVLLRLYQVGDNEDVIQGVTVATNSQNPVDFRDLKANDDHQVLLEQNAKELGYTYKRKKDNQTSTDTIPSSVAAESVFSVWRKKPHLAKYKKAELFGQFYEDVFANLNAAQMIIAVLLFRHCDNMRRKPTTDKDVQSQRAYSQYLIAAMIGKQLLISNELSLQKLDHNNFIQIRDYWEENKDELYSSSEQKLLEQLKNYFRDPLIDIDGRTMSAAFRRFEFVNKLLDD